MNITKKQFEQWVAEALDSLPEKVLERMHNVAIFVEDAPSPEQKRQLRLRRDSLLFGLYEGYHQALRLNVGPVLPDRITIFRLPITRYCQTEAQVKAQIKDTIQHEIAHHFGSDERGAHKAGKRKMFT
jgi:predicted Zn-dependent protease with MMP-like domain